MTSSTISATHTVTADGLGPVPVSYTERGAGRPVLLLHGGAGPQSVTGFGDLLAGSGPARSSSRSTPGSAARRAPGRSPAWRAWPGSTPSCWTTSG